MWLPQGVDVTLGEMVVSGKDSSQRDSAESSQWQHSLSRRVGGGGGQGVGGSESSSPEEGGARAAAQSPRCEC